MINFKEYIHVQILYAYYRINYVLTGSVKTLRIRRCIYIVGISYILRYVITNRFTMKKL